MKALRKTFIMLAGLVLLCSCTEIELASHVAKKGMRDKSPSTPSQGTFKVGTPYKINGKWYYPSEQYEYEETGIASWYGPGFHGKKTANGEKFDQHELTAAHRTLQMPSLVRVTNLDNGKSLIVRVNDRGPYKRGRVIDVSEKAAELLGFKGRGTAKVKLQVLPEESLKIAQAARSGQVTKGYELAVAGQPPSVSGAAPASVQQAAYAPHTQGGTSGMYQTASLSPADGPALGVESVSRETLSSPVPASGNMQQIVPGHTRNGEFYPDPIVTEMPVVPSHIYVQAGSFSVHDNAVRLSQTLQRLGPANVYETTVNGQRFYRVRLGPIRDVAAADTLLAQVVQSGQGNAIIVVE